VKKYRSSYSFSLVEVVLVLAIVGILLSLSLRSISRLADGARKTKAIACLRAIAEAYRRYMEEQGHPIRWKDLDQVREGPAGYDVTLIAAVLAKGGYLQSVDAWAWDFDYRVKKYLAQKSSLPPTFCDIVRDGSGSVTGATVHLNARGKSGFPTSVCAVVAANGCTNDEFFCDASEIPIAYSRGLREGTAAPGTWADQKLNVDLGGIFGNGGGFVVFLDGHVSWFGDLGAAGRCVLRKYGTQDPTNIVAEALPRGALRGAVDANSMGLSWKGEGTDCGDF
jgi:type II secretory pathway pseudopilin PulG